MAGSTFAIALLRSGVSAVFLASGILKLNDPARFLLDVEAFELLPHALNYAAALALPWLEILAALGLWWQRLATGSAILLSLATASFLAAIALATARGTALDCGCFGDWLVFPTTATHVAFNCGLLAGCLILVRHPITNRE